MQSSLASSGSPAGSQLSVSSAETKSSISSLSGDAEDLFPLRIAYFYGLRFGGGAFKIILRCGAAGEQQRGEQGRGNDFFHISLPH